MERDIAKRAKERAALDRLCSQYPEQNEKNWFAELDQLLLNNPRLREEYLSIVARGIL